MTWVINPDTVFSNSNIYDMYLSNGESSRPSVESRLGAKTSVTGQSAVVEKHTSFYLVKWILY